MNEMLLKLNSLGQSFVTFAWPMLAQSGVLIAFLFLLNFILRKKVRAVFRYYLWMLVLIKLLLPTTLSLPTGIGYWTAIPQSLMEKRHDREGVFITSRDREEAGIILPSNTERLHRIDDSTTLQPKSTVATIPAAQIKYEAIIFVTWSAVVLIMTLLMLQRYWFVRGLIAQAKPTGGKSAEMLRDCCRQMGIATPPILKLSPAMVSPALCGLVRPTILLPEFLSSKLRSRELQTVLLHELAHLRRGDLWINLLQTILQIIYFYNPLLWLANTLIRRTREQAVDETVLVALGEKADDYPETLLTIANFALTRPALSLRMIGVVESKSALAGRIKHILNRPIPKTAKLGLVGFLGILLVGSILLPMAKAKTEDKTNGQPDYSAVVQAAQNVNAYFYTMKPARSLSTIDFKSTWYFKGIGRVRDVSTIQGVDQIIQVTDLHKNEQISLNPLQQQATLVTLPPRTTPLPTSDTQLAATLQARTKDAKLTLLGKKTVDQHETFGYQFDTDNKTLRAKFRRIVWADSKTLLPVRIEETNEYNDPTNPLSKPQHNVLSDFVFNPSLNDSLFSTDPPKGYKLEVIKDFPPLLPTQDNFLQGLKLWAELNGGQFPDSLTVLEMMKVFRTISNPSKQLQIQQVLSFVRQQDQTNPESWGYAGKGVKLGEKEKPVFGYRPDNTTTYRIIYGDLSVKQVSKDQFDRMGFTKPTATSQPASQPASNLNSNRPNLDKQIPFKCSDCGTVVKYTIGKLQKMPKLRTMSPMMGPLVLDCPKCKREALTQAVECLKCGEIFIMKMDPDKKVFDDRCPKCGTSYAKAWQEKYRKSTESKPPSQPGNSTQPDQMMVGQAHPTPVIPAQAGIQNLNADSQPELKYLAWQPKDENKTPEVYWYPNGHPLKNPAELKMLGKVRPVIYGNAFAKKLKVLSFWFSHPLFDRCSVGPMSLLNPNGQPMAFYFSYSFTEAGTETGNLPWMVFTTDTSFDKFPPQADIRFRYSLGEWKYNESPTRMDSGATQSFGQDEYLGPVGQNERKEAFVSLIRDRTKNPDTQFDFVAIKKDGKEIERRGGMSSGQETRLVETFTFACPLSEIKEFRLRTRPIRSIIFKNVSLEPGKMTDVKIETNNSSIEQSTSSTRQSLLSDLEKLATTPGIKVQDQPGAFTAYREAAENALKASGLEKEPPYWEKFLRKYPLTPHSLQAMNILGIVYGRLSLYSEAQRMLNVSLRLADGTAFANTIGLNLAWVDTEDNHLDAAETRLRKIIAVPVPTDLKDWQKVTPQLFSAPFQLAKVYEKRGQVEQADRILIEAGERALAMAKAHTDISYLASYAIGAYRNRIELIYNANPENISGARQLAEEMKTRCKDLPGIQNYDLTYDFHLWTNHLQSAKSGRVSFPKSTISSRPATRPADFKPLDQNKVGQGPAYPASLEDKKEGERLSAQAWQLWRERKLKDAEEMFKKAVAKDPANANAWNGLGWSLFNQGMPLNAQDAFEKCLSIEPKHGAALNGLGWIAKGQKKNDEAIKYWEKVVEAAPGATASLSGLAKTYMEMKQYNQAIKYYQLWLNVEPGSQEAKDGLKAAQESELAFAKSGKSLLPVKMVGTWSSDRFMGGTEQMSIFPDGRVAFFWSNGHRDETRYEDGKIYLKEYECTVKTVLVDDRIVQITSDEPNSPDSSLAKVWIRIADQPSTKLLRPLTGTAMRPAAPSVTNSNKPGEKQTYIVTFDAMRGTKPRTAGELRDLFNQKYPRNMRSHHYRTKVENNELVGMICVDTDKGIAALRSAVKENPNINLIDIQPASPSMLEIHNKLGQPDLPEGKTADEGSNRQPNDMERKVARIRIGMDRREDVIRIFGKPAQYRWGGTELNVNNLTDRYLMAYPDNFRVAIYTGIVSEIRFERPSEFVHPTGVRVGMKLDDVLTALGPPVETITGKPIGFADGVLYKNTDGRDGFDYYARADKGVRMFFVGNRVSALYLTKSVNGTGGQTNNGVKLKKRTSTKQPTIEAEDNTSAHISKGQTIQDAVRATMKWIKLIDTEKFDDAYRPSADYFKSQVPQKDFTDSVKKARENFGKLTSRKVISKTYLTSLPGAPDGEYVVIQFATSFENKKEAIETVTPMKEKDGTWRVSGYFIK
ncbi:MAG: M56 family metallopeptidase [Phycisphaerae bacterium]